MRRQWHVAIGELQRHVTEFVLQLRATRNDGTLVRRPRTQPAANRPRAEIGLRLLRGHARNRTGDANLSLDLLPQKRERRERILRQLRALAKTDVKLNYRLKGRLQPRDRPDPIAFDDKGGISLTDLGS